MPQPSKCTSQYQTYDIFNMLQTPFGHKQIEAASSSFEMSPVFNTPKKTRRSEMLSRASAAVVLWVLPSCVVKQPPQRHQFQARCPSGMSLHRQLQVLQLVPDPRWERLIGVQKLKCHKWMQLLGESIAEVCCQ